MQTEFQKSKKRFPPSVRMRHWLPAIAAALSLWSCLAASRSGNPGSHQLPVEAFWAGSRSGYEARQPLVRWVTDQKHLEAAVAAAKSAALANHAAQHPVDWERYGLVWVYMGLKPSGGYALSLAAPAATISAGVAVITVRWRQPGPGSVVTQQLTSPCLILKLARDKFHIIQINDEAGRVRVSLELDNE